MFQKNEKKVKKVKVAIEESFVYVKSINYSVFNGMVFQVDLEERVNRNDFFQALIISKYLGWLKFNCTDICLRKRFSEEKLFRQ